MLTMLHIARYMSKMQLEIEGL